MSSKYIKSQKPQSKNASKDHQQVEVELTGAKIVPIYGSPAFEKKELPMEIDRKFGPKFGRKGKDGKRKLIGNGWLETEYALKKRVNTKADKYDRVHIKWITKTRHIQHYKV